MAGAAEDLVEGAGGASFWMEMGFRTKAKIELCVIRQIFEVKGRLGEARAMKVGRVELGRANLKMQLTERTLTGLTCLQEALVR